METEDRFFLTQAARIAKLGEAKAFPNPFVGAVIVYENTIIAQGFHQKFGEAHAEPNAINNLREAFLKNPKNGLFKNFSSVEDLIKESSLYISLEPCNHYGKTPPCTKLIYDLGFKRVIYGYKDPFLKSSNTVAAFTLEDLEKSGIKVLYLEDKNFEFDNRIFLKLLKKKKNYWLSIKVASYSDGSMLTREENSWITNSNSRKEVQRLRATHEILITGINTIKMDNPQLNVRFPPEELGLADICEREIFILKSKQDFSETERKNLQIFSQSNTQKTLYQSDKVSQRCHEIKIDMKNPKALKDLLEQISEKKKLRIMVEAGPKLSTSFLQSGLVDEIIHYEKRDLNLSEEKQSQRALARYENLLKENSIALVKNEILKCCEESDDIKIHILTAEKN